MLAEVFLHLGAIEDLLFHAVTERAIIHLEEKQDTFLAGCTGLFEFLREVTEGRVEEMMLRVARVLDSGAGEGGEQQSEESQDEG